MHQLLSLVLITIADTALASRIDTRASIKAVSKPKQFSIRSKGLARAYRKSTSTAPPGLGASGLRRALSEIGNDVSLEHAQHLVTLHGDGERLRLREFDHLVRHDPSTSAARFWLTIDKDGTNGIRRSRTGFARFGKAGSLTPTRLAHFAVGGGSLVVGTIDMIQYIAAAGMVNMPIDVAVAHGALHTAAALLSLPRFRYVFNEQKLWRGWLVKGSDVAMWPSFITYAWYTLSFKSDLLLPVDQALFSFTHPVFVSLTHLTTFWLVYMTLRAVEEDNGRSLHYTLNVGLVMALPILLDPIRCLYFSQSVSAHAAYNAFIATTYPSFTNIAVGNALGAMYIGNVLCALQSAKHHRAVTTEQVVFISIALASIYAFFPIYASLQVDGLVPAALDAVFWIR